MKAVIHLAAALSATAAFGDNTEPVLLTASYLSEPTEWCPKDAGIPVIVTLPELLVFKPVKHPSTRPTTIVRRGTEVEREDISQIEPGVVRNRRGLQVFDISGSDRGSRSDPNSSAREKYGALRIVAKLCDLYWLNEINEVQWTLKGLDGKQLQSGQGAPDANLWQLLRGKGQFYNQIAVGDIAFPLKQELEVNQRIETFVSPNEE